LTRQLPLAADEVGATNVEVEVRITGEDSEWFLALLRVAHEEKQMLGRVPRRVQGAECDASERDLLAFGHLA
jgi:hypothetical protein